MKKTSEKLKEKMVQKSKKPKQRRSRADTEQKLIDVALELIRNKGVLAGLNLREVADGAGVNRGNIYHYFGSRQELLRSAINRQFGAIVDSLTKGVEPARFVARRLRAFRMHSRDNANDSQLRALLVLDGDNTVDPIPLYEATLSQLRQDVIDGDIHRDHDLEALQVALSALLRGYRIFRLPYARRVGVSPKELDKRFSRILETWLKAMAKAPKDSLIT
ncbi:MAG: TetR/AcrR family transcriptional regulator [Gammaproteobacteria bacterium]|jgi:AcrR family transcriptional regulator|nr:TetR/AcrR family transcriptional regulator [Gammaproteobacteria bacterium]